MSLVSSLLGAYIGCLAVAEPAESVVTTAEPTEPTEPTEPAAPTVPPPTQIQPNLVQPAILRPAPRPEPRPILVTAPPRPRKSSPETSRLPRGWAIDMSAGTSLPIAAGAALQVETPPRILAQVELGGLPSGYVDLQNLITRGGGPSASLARGASRRAFVVRAALGVRPLKRRGLEVRAGYTGALLGQDVTTLATIAAAADTDLGDVDRDVVVESAIHSVHAEAGWRWLIRGHFLVRAAVGYVQSLGARLAVSPEPQASEDSYRDADLALERVARVAATTAVRSPTLTLHVGYRF